MKNIFSLSIPLLFLFASCSEEEKETPNSSKAGLETIDNTQAIQDSLIQGQSKAIQQKKDSLKISNLNTLQNTTRHHKLSLYNKPYQLTVRNFSLTNDKKSDEVKITDGAAHILLKQNQQSIFDVTVKMELFRDNYFKEDVYSGLLFSHAEYTFSRSNRIFFSIYLTDPEKGTTYEILIGIDYMDKPGDIMITTYPKRVA